MCVMHVFAVPEGRVKLFTLNPVSRVLHTKSNQSAKEDRDDDFKFQVCFEGSQSMWLQGGLAPSKRRG